MKFSMLQRSSCRHRTGQWERLEVPADAHPHRQLRQAERSDVEHTTLWQALDTLQRPVVDVLGVLGDFVVLGQRLGEEGLELVVVRRLAGVAAHAGVWILDATIDAFE